MPRNVRCRSTAACLRLVSPRPCWLSIGSMSAVMARAASVRTMSVLSAATTISRAPGLRRGVGSEPKNTTDKSSSAPAMCRARTATPTVAKSPWRRLSSAKPNISFSRATGKNFGDHLVVVASRLIQPLKESAGRHGTRRATLIEDDPRIERHGDRGHLRGGVGEGEAAAGGAPVANRHMCDMRHRQCDQRDAIRDQR